MKRSTSTLRFILAFPFGMVSELFATLTVLVSGGQCDVNFNRIDKDYYGDN